MNPDAQLLQLLSLDAAAPMQTSDETRRAVRDLLRHGGFKPTAAFPNHSRRFGNHRVRRLEKKLRQS